MLDLTTRGLKQLHLRMDEHSLSHHDMVTVAKDAKAKRVLGVLEDDRLSTLEEFLKKISACKVREVHHGDGANWIKEGISWLPKAKLVLG